MKTSFFLLFILYLIVLVKVILFKDALFFQIVPVDETYQEQSANKSLVRYNLVPFRTILLFLRDVEKTPRFFNLYGNILLFIPFGFLLPLVWKKAFRFSRVLICTLLLSTSFEIYQFLTRTGHADIDDVILNTTGGLLGFFFITVYFRRKEQKKILHPR